MTHETSAATEANPFAPTIPQTIPTAAALDLAAVQAAMQALATIRTELNTRYLESDDRIDVILTALIARQHVALLGPAGEGKSALVDAVRSRILGAHGFKTLMMRTSTPETVFGAYDIQALQNGHYRRRTDHRLPQAVIAFLDEIFKANDTVLNSLLMAMNEREFEQDGLIETIPLVSLIGASNEMPQGDNLDALWDRFTLRLWVAPLSRGGRRQFVGDEMQRRGAAAAGQDTLGRTGTTITLAQLALLQQAALRVTIPMTVQETYWKIEEHLDLKGLPLPSTRRLGWQWGLIAATALLNGRMTATEGDLTILRHSLWQEKAQIKEVTGVVLTVATPIIAKAREVYDALVADIEETLVLGRQLAAAKSGKGAANAATENDLLKRVMEAQRKANGAIDRLKQLHQQARGANLDAEPIRRLGVDATARYEQLVALSRTQRPTW